MNELEKARNIINSTDTEMAKLFEQRMDAVRMVANYKKKHGIPVDDLAREAEIIARNSEMINSDEYRSFYVDFLRSTIDISKNFQHRLLDCANDFAIEKSDCKILKVESSYSPVGSYDIVLERGSIRKVGEYLNLARKVLIVTDSGVPAEYANIVAEKCLNPYVVTVEQGEATKNLDTFTYLLSKLVEYNFTRSDCVIAVGGGVVGDLAGFTASAYMRGIDFYNIPTTVLSQVDSSIGGKTAVDFMGIKNIVGAFYPPKRVVIDPETLNTLPKRQIYNGLAESVKMSLTNDKELFELFENEDVIENIDTIIKRSLLIKKSVVEAYEKESGLCRVLNFGHTLAHAIESSNGMENLYHGECVAIGMVPMCSQSVRPRLINVLKKLSLPYEFSSEDINTVINACSHDKKLTGGEITVVYVQEVGTFEFRKMPFSEYEKTIRKVLE